MNSNVAVLSIMTLQQKKYIFSTRPFLTRKKIKSLELKQIFKIVFRTKHENILKCFTKSHCY